MMIEFAVNLGVTAYHVLTYRFLDRLQKCLEKEYSPFDGYLAPLTKAFPIEEREWTCLLFDLLSSGYIKGLQFAPYDGSELNKFVFDHDFSITQMGIEYLREDENMKKIREFFN